MLSEALKTNTTVTSLDLTSEKEEREKVINKEEMMSG